MRVLRRMVIERKHGHKAIFREVLKNKWERLSYRLYINRSTEPERIGYRFPRERFLSNLILGVFALATVSTVANALTPSTVRGAVIDLELIAAQSPTVAKVLGPINWTTGKASLKGNKKAVMGAYNYAQAADYTFAANDAERDRLVANGALVKLDSRYIRLNNASSPYVLPVVARFVDRLGEQYAAAGCGKLIVNGGMRPLDFQGTLKNGSSHSVHPTGMPVDLFRDTDENSYCYKWLEGRLITIEADRRIDATAEDYNRHFHVVVVPSAYEAYLARLPQGLDPEEQLLATALYFEAAFNESHEGYRAIGWAIRNRVRSSEFPNTVVEVVADGSAGRSAGGCQFSFMCDGKAERIQTLCAKPNALMSQYWLGKCDERWNVVVNIAKQILAEPESADPTGGAVLYYAASMDKAPDWTIDMKPGTVHRIGSHIFSCSLHRGSDACRS